MPDLGEEGQGESLIAYTPERKKKMSTLQMAGVVEVPETFAALLAQLDERLQFLLKLEPAIPVLSPTNAPAPLAAEFFGLSQSQRKRAQANDKDHAEEKEEKENDGDDEEEEDGFGMAPPPLSRVQSELAPSMGAALTASLASASGGTASLPVSPEKGIMHGGEDGGEAEAASPLSTVSLSPQTRPLTV